MAWLDVALMRLARITRKMAAMRSRGVDPNDSISRQAIGIYVSALKRLTLYVVLLLIVWAMALALGKLLPIGVATILLVLSTLLFGVAAWPIAFVFFEHERYQKIAASIVATELCVGLAGMYIRIPLSDVLMLQIAGLYLVFSGYLGKAKGIRLWGNRFVAAIMAFIVISAVAPAFAGALRSIPSAVDNAAARVTISMVGTIQGADNPISNTQTQSGAVTIQVPLPVDGSPSAEFNPLTAVPAGWSYRIDNAPVGTAIDWTSGASPVSYKEMANYPAQPFSLSHGGGGGGHDNLAAIPVYLRIRSIGRPVPQTPQTIDCPRGFSFL